MNGSSQRYAWARNILGKPLLALLLALCAMPNAYAQLTGTRNIPGDYATLALAITDLNTVGVGAGGVTLNLIAGNPQAAPAGGYSITATGTAANPIVIQGNGNAIVAFTPQATGNLNDALFKILGSDFVTLTGFIMRENPANTTTSPGNNNMTEWGVALLYATTTNGAQNVTVIGNTVDLDRTYQNTFGIYSNSTHSAAVVTTSATATTAAGGNSGLVIRANVITDVNIGIVVVGPTAAADHNEGLDIGGVSLATGNSLTNYGTTAAFSGYANVSGTVNGILVRNTRNFSVAFNTVQSSVGGTTNGTLRGIFVPAFSSAPTGTLVNSITNNNISVNSGVAAGAIFGILVEGNSANATTTINVNNNDFNSSGHTVAGTAGITFLSEVSLALNHNINNNTFTNLSVNTTGNVTLISNNVTHPANAVTNVNGNSIVTAFNKTGIGGTLRLYDSFSTSPASCTETNTGNNFSNITVVGTTIFGGWRSGDGSTTAGVRKTVTNNIFSNISVGTGTAVVLVVEFSDPNFTGTNISGNRINNVTAGGLLTGISANATNQAENFISNTVHSLSSTGAAAVSGIAIGNGTLMNLQKNTIYNLENSNAGGSVHGISIANGNTINVENNLIGDLRVPNGNLSNSLVGINASLGTNINVSFNTVRLQATSVGTDFGSSAVSMPTVSALTLRNNILVNLSTSTGTGRTVAYRRSGSDQTNYSAASNNNDFYAGTPGPNNLIYSDGSNFSQTLADYQTLVTPRDSASVSANPAFLSTVGGTAGFLHLDTTLDNPLVNGGTPVTGITTDFDNDPRAPFSPTIGADEPPLIDLRIVKSDGAGVNSEIPGTAITYTLTVSNNGPTAVSGAVVTDNFPASLGSCTWTCGGIGPNPGVCTASGAGNINDTAVNFLVPSPDPSEVRYSVTCQIDPAATGNLDNTASVRTFSRGELTPADNTSTDTDTLVPTGDVSISKSDGATTEVPGSQVTYTTIVSNSGPSTVSGATVTDAFPSSLSGCSTTCVASGTASCSPVAIPGDVNDSVTLPPTTTATYTSVCTIDPSATGNLVNTASVSVPGTFTDTDPLNNSATDTDTLTPQYDVSITKTDGAANEVPGTSVTYTITAAWAAGPSAAPASLVTDTFPAALTGCTWTCSGTGATCAGSGNDNISDTVNFTAIGGTAVYTATCNIAATANGTLDNTATVAIGPSDTNAANNSATDSDTLTPQYDLTITKTDGASSEVPGTPVAYTITATWAAGPSTPPASLVTDTAPAALSGCSWICTGTNATCAPSGSGNLSDSVVFGSVGANAAYVFTCEIDPDATGSLVNTASVAAGAGDVAPANNSATDTDTLTPEANLSISKTDGVTSVTPGQSLSYTVRAENFGPSSTLATVYDALPSALNGCTWTCLGSDGGSCAASGSGNLLETVTLDVDGLLQPEGGNSAVTFTVNCTVAATASGSIVNTAQVVTQGATTDPDNANNTATDTDTVNRVADVTIFKSDSAASEVPGSPVSYSIVAGNIGPDATGATVTDNLPVELQSCTWNCSGSGGGSCPASGSGAINAAVQLPVGGVAAFTLNCTVAVSASGSLVNTASVLATDTGTSDPVSANNSFTDTDTLGGGSANLGVSVTDNREFVEVGEALTTIITVSNAGPSNSPTNTVTSTLPTELSGGAWTCIAFGGATCAAGSGSSLSDTPNMPVGSQVAYVWSTTVQPGSPDDTFAVAATVAVGGTASDPTPANNTASDTPADVIVIFKDGFDGPVTGVLEGFTDANGYSQARLLLDADLLASLGLAPITIAAGEKANGSRLFRIELARFDNDTVLRLVMRDAAGLERAGAWQVVNLERRQLDFAWQPAAASAATGYLRVGVAGVDTVLTQRSERDTLVRLRVPLNHGNPALRPAD